MATKSSSASASEQRAAKVAEFKKAEAAARRTRVIGWTAGIGAAVIAAVVVVAVVVANSSSPSATPTGSAGSSTITGLTTFTLAAGVHVTTPVDYEKQYGMNPPAGGEHNPVWLNCGIYDQPQQNENAVHSLEHGAVWITYDPTVVTGADLDTLRAAIPSTYAILSPYPNLPAPVVASAWGAQVQLDGVDDARLATFIQTYWRAATSPEPAAACTGALDGPGRIG